MLLTALGGKILQMRKKNCQKRGSYPPVPVGIDIYFIVIGKWKH